jgi:hypothetical protein
VIRANPESACVRVREFDLHQIVWPRGPLGEQC